MKTRTFVSLTIFLSALLSLFLLTAFVRADTSVVGLVKNPIDTLGTGNDALGFVLGPDHFARIAFITDWGTEPIMFARCTDADCTSLSMANS